MFRLGILIGLIALIGVTLSGLVAYRVYNQDISLDDAALERAVDIHARLVQDRLSERELLTRIISELMRKPALLRGNVLEPLRSSIYAFKTDFVVAGWVARIPPSDLLDAQKQLAAAGFTRPEIRDSEDQQLDVRSINQPLDVLMDVEPRNSQTLIYPGRTFNQHPVLGPLLARAALERKPLSSDPLPLAGDRQSIGVVLVAPIVQDGATTVAGFLTFSYRLAPLVLANEDGSPFRLALQDPQDSARQIVADSREQTTIEPVRIAADAQVLTRVVQFGGRQWVLRYYPGSDPRIHAGQVAAIIAVIGLALTSIVCGLFGYVVYNNVRLSREIEVRIGFENRLTAVIGELNHRVKNILAVIQSIVTRTLRHGADIDTARELLIGRIHAMSNVVSLLSDSQWQGVKLRGLLESRAIPHAERIAIDGPDISVSPRAAQSLSLLFFELASHADEGLSLVGKHPNISAHWQVRGEGKAAIFDFRWEEFNTSEATRRPDSDFGIILLDRVAPEALGGTARRYFSDVSYVYELTAPMETVVDQAELDRTDRIATSLPQTSHRK
ncbi:HWE histidine kinase domain-containing protein [Bradyrhizobium sp. WD16]|uniref:CHASE domain-containing protein n=1 Tax=Bradyrhizobium sp. WD16 TaxID=1521768 RepID=UPI0020A2B62A|nr:HWE histidine kinase domain-containing protein [Bradyrhizobium sp. WD16]UTD27468.1 histidine kinase [Bradyrhizobium sp. WD16]